MQARRIARELALLALSQLPSSPDKIASQDLPDLLLAAVRTLTAEVHDALSNAAADLSRSHDRLLNSETRAKTLEDARAMVNEAMTHTETAINRLGTALELPEILQLSNRKEVRALALSLLTAFHENRDEIDDLLSRSLVDWQLNRLARVDRDILRLAAAELVFLGHKENVTITEAVELAKRYSSEDGYKFINGVLRRVTEQLRQPGGQPGRQVV
ncbi:transcription antitermination factor NusB [Leptolyngbya sp. FACHB-261]|uniref:transcription antitermination factor NusB n=1 Tax=Leptolyngbya sp. FACHB-261 TaxID=2692806 RepID=UPI00168901AA|nr:transcription antitermination factor NusB [Leptolyngbya sp. FACHB-261]MBD2099353.1 transcription antitermination protein NusB [Leptolyngbya sp. FACHB-261]